MEENDYELISMDDVFSNELIKLMKEYRIDNSCCSKEQFHKTIALATLQSRKCYEDFMMWVLYGDDSKARTLGLLKAILRNKSNNLVKRLKRI